MNDETTPPNNKQSAKGPLIAQAQGPGASASVNISIYKQAPTQVVDETTLEQAQATLSQLPTDAVPDPSANLPPGSKTLFLSNPNFVGREAELKSLAISTKKALSQPSLQSLV